MFPLYLHSLTETGETVKFFISNGSEANKVLGFLKIRFGGSKLTTYLCTPLQNKENEKALYKNRQKGKRV